MTNACREAWIGLHCHWTRKTPDKSFRRLRKERIRRTKACPKRPWSARARNYLVSGHANFRTEVKQIFFRIWMWIGSYPTLYKSDSHPQVGTKSDTTRFTSDSDPIHIRFGSASLQYESCQTTLGIKPRFRTVSWKSSRQLSWKC